MVRGRPETAPVSRRTHGVAPGLLLNACPILIFLNNWTSAIAHFRRRIMSHYQVHICTAKGVQHWLIVKQLSKAIRVSISRISTAIRAMHQHDLPPVHRHHPFACAPSDA